MYIYTGKPTIHGAPQQKVLASQVSDRNLHSVFCIEKLLYCSSHAEANYMDRCSKMLKQNTQEPKKNL